MKDKCFSSFQVFVPHTLYEVLKKLHRQKIVFKGSRTITVLLIVYSYLDGIMDLTQKVKPMRRQLK
jgi:hypothetical protein